MKASNHTFLLLAILPVPKFLHMSRKIQGVLENHFIHECTNFVIKLLKKAVEIRIMMTDLCGWHWYCFTPLVSAIVDTPEALMYAGVSKNASPVTMAICKQFSDSFHHKPQTASTTIAQLTKIETVSDLWDFMTYLTEVKQFQLNDIHQPFW